MDQAQALCEGPLSYSIRQWLGLVESAVAIDAPCIRDCPTVRPVENFFSDPAVRNAMVILESGESDVYWTVENERLQEDDPPVLIFQMYDESSPALVGRNGSVSEFALKYLCVYNEFAVGNTEWFSADCTDDERRTVVDWFDHALAFDADDGMYDRFELLESNNIAAIAIGNRIEVSVFCDPALLEMPPFLKTKMDAHLQLRASFRNSLQ